MTENAVEQKPDAPVAELAFQNERNPGRAAHVAPKALDLDHSRPVARDMREMLPNCGFTREDLHKPISANADKWFAKSHNQPPRGYTRGFASG